MTLRHQRFVAAGAGAVALAVALAGCSGGSGSSGSGGTAKSRTIYTEATTNPTSFDPATAHAGDDYVADSLLYDTVLHRDDDGSIIGGLATKWTADSASKYSFTIRKDATCADGTPITASVVANSLNYLGQNKTGDHVFAPLVFGVGAPTITADDQTSTVTIETAGPYANLLPGLTVAQSAIVCPAGLADTEGLKAGTVKGAFSGPYTLGEAKPGVSYTYDLRKDYKSWPKYSKPLKGVPASKIVFGIATDQATTANKLLSGDLDIGNIGGETLNRFKGKDYNQVTTVIANVYVMFNERAGHYFADKPDARKAVAQAIDRSAFNKVFSAGVSPLFNSIVPKTYDCANTDKSLIEKYDKSAAAKVLTGANIKMVASTAFGDQGKGAEYIQQVLSDAGAKVDLKKTDNATWATETQKPGGDWDITIMGDINAAKLISSSLDRVMGPSIEQGGRNIGANNNPDGAAALKAALATTDKTQQCKDYQTAQKTMLERDDVVPLGGIVWNTTSQPDVVVKAPGGTLNYTTTRIVSN
ncbi:peptide/nickel transport system substrate-binding protein [Antricoccus suffuscus]|uniref:Peptide/nickel transport system substrate-binding protein n=1 Tax=Antricoccus suffuscus TaxID=1629062 RepID=A0A2T0ZXV5_9ACTN|nr:ABC transporter substrate-binding protein [Antricoccus suffuscus]PRZ41185.1 peptide/nickel transport system substrate-binding protein [Antricoccus suffuscus]